MAIVDSNPFGPMRGKMGGLVFTKSKGHQTVRSYIKNTRSLSVAQSINRSILTGLSKSWKSLMAPIPAAWNSWAYEGFAPLGKTNVGQYSGFQAYLSNQMVFQHMNNWDLTFTVTMNGGLGVLGFTGFPSAPFSTPENTTIVPWLRRSVAPHLPITFTSCTLNGSHVINARMTWGHSPGLTPDLPVFQDPNGLGMGFAWYMSEKLSNAYSVAKHPYRQLIATTGIILITTPPPVGSLYADFLSTPGNLYQNSKSFPGSGYLLQNKSHCS